jgi:hypothetical protein
VTKLRSEMTWLEKLRELRRVANFENADFNELVGGDVVLKPGEITDFIRERTRLYRGRLIRREERVRDRRNKGRQR